MNVLVTGSGGLIGSEAARRFSSLGHTVHGVDDNSRKAFFGEAGDVSANVAALSSGRGYVHHSVDVRDREKIFALFRAVRFDAVIHAAAQPSHDKAREIPLVDFEVNAVGTLNLLEAARLHAPEAAFVFFSTNKVYGDAPNELPLRELETRYDYAREEDRGGIAEDCRIDRSVHSLFGVSKAAADLLVQEYAKTYGMKTGVFRAGCLTGPAHRGVELHGFLSYLAKAAVSGAPYTVFGYKGKQVRDHLHAADAVSAAEAFIAAPRAGEVYNLGGGRANSLSVLEAISAVEKAAGKKLAWKYDPKNRLGDHVCYISDTSKFEAHYPVWKRAHALPAIVEEIVNAEKGSRP